MRGDDMSSEHQSSPQSLPHHLQLIQMGNFVVPQVLYVAAELGLADELQWGNASGMSPVGPSRHFALLREFGR
jgi:hypothetical protein